MPFALLLMSVLERAFFRFEVGLKQNIRRGRGRQLDEFFFSYYLRKGASSAATDRQRTV